jgi:hypothetical protein
MIDNPAGRLAFATLILAGYCTAEEADQALSRIYAQIPAPTPSGVADQIQEAIDLVRTGYKVRRD